MRSLILALSVLFLGTSGSFADDKAPPAGDFDPAAIQQLFQAHAETGPEHEHLKRMVGEWKTVMRDHMSKPGEVVESRGEAKIRAILGGRFIQQRVTGSVNGEKYQGTGISGYNNATEKYTGVWLDNMGTGIMTMEGTYDPETEEMVEIGSYDGPIGKMTFRMVSKQVSDDEIRFTMHSKMTPDAPETKCMEMVYTRIK